ncbi:very long chain fatty acid elongase 7 [Dermatophagoides farinae]|uniref:very long chain fatty acid elongase 7 n=1 Tax=Dermatophagoides farinae TaxID=6954 RepID=UPI003F6306B7
MTHMLETIWYYCHQYWIDIQDPRTADYAMIGGGAWKIAIVVFGYWLLVKKILPNYMHNRPPYDLKTVILIYNLMMILTNAAFFFFLIKYVEIQWFFDFKYPDRNDRSPLAMEMLWLSWFGYISRFFDMFDTIFFVLRKKYNQITFLHVYHHMIVPFLGWFSFKLNPLIPIIMLFAAFNTVIHVIMYSYYAIASFGPEMQKYLWWKKYITQLQLLQFMVCGLYGILLYFQQTGYPMIWFIVAVGQNPIFFYMFYDFYRQAYQDKSKKLDKNDKFKSTYIMNGNGKKGL